MEISYTLKYDINDRVNMLKVDIYDDDIKATEIEYILDPFVKSFGTLSLSTNINSFKEYTSIQVPTIIEPHELKDLIETIRQFKNNDQIDENSKINFKIVKDRKDDEKMETLLENVAFEAALPFLKKGFPIARKGWNGKGMFVIYQKGYPDGINCNKQTAEAWGIKEGDLFICNPYFQIRCVDGSHSMWVPSINDILSEDWVVMTFKK